MKLCIYNFFSSKPKKHFISQSALEADLQVLYG